MSENVATAQQSEQGEQVTPPVSAPLAIQQVKTSQLSRALGANWERLVDRDTFAATMAKGGPEAQKYVRELQALASTIADGADNLTERKTVAGAYTVRGLDTLAGGKAANDEVARLAGNVSVSRVSQLRRYAKLIFDLRFDPEYDPEWNQLVRAANSATVRKAMDADGATRESVLEAFYSENEYVAKDGAVTGAWQKKSKPAARGAGSETAAEKSNLKEIRSNPARIDALEKLLADITLGEDDGAEWVRLAEFSRTLEDFLDTSPAKASAGRAANGKGK